MDAPVPIACSLAPGEIGARKNEWLRLAERAESRTERAHGARLVFSAARGLEAELEDLIEKESTCCPFFTFRLARTEETLTLDIGAPGGVEQLALELLGLPTQGR